MLYVGNEGYDYPVQPLSLTRVLRELTESIDTDYYSVGQR